jgi:hypothetical protein
MTWLQSMVYRGGMTKLAAGGVLSLIVAACGSGGAGGHLDGSSNPVSPGSANGKSTIELGVPVKGTVELSDHHYYVIGPPTVSGYEDVYQIEVTADTTYTVNCTSDYVTIEDADSGGEFTARGGTQSAAMNCFDSPATWLPRRTGVVTINVLAAADEVPQSYTMTFSR